MEKRWASGITQVAILIPWIEVTRFDVFAHWVVVIEDHKSMAVLTL
jgi:hypothetical protein